MNNILCTSVAGGGKTTYIVNLLKEIPSDKKVLLLSFSNATCDELKKRTGREVFTLHSFLYQYLCEDYIIEENIKPFLYPLIYNFPELNLNEITKLVESYLIFNIPGEGKLENAIKELVDKLREEQKKYKIIFFPDIFYKITWDKLVYMEYDYLIIDECQDFSLIQLRVIYTLIEELFLYKTFVIVGDPNQSIYDFQGASKEYYLNFLEDIEKLCKKYQVFYKKIYHNLTYRFGGEILKLVNSKYITHISNKDTGEVNIIYTNKLIEQSIDTIRNLLNKYNPEEIVVLYAFCSEKIKKIQEKFMDYGYDLKINLLNSVVWQNITYLIKYILYNDNYFKIKVIHGCFFNSIKYKYDKFFDKIKNITNPSILLMNISYLHSNKLEQEIFYNICKLSENYINLYEFLNLEPIIYIKKEGLNFSTIHNAKGKEYKVCVFIDEKFNFLNTTCDLYPFKIYKKKFSISSEMYYVAYTRAKEYFISLKEIS